MRISDEAHRVEMQQRRRRQNARVPGWRVRQPPPTPLELARRRGKPPSFNVLVLSTHMKAGHLKEKRYHFTKGFRTGFA